MKPEPANDTRERLLQAAMELMWQRSFQAAGVDELCRLAGARKGSFYHFFPSKTDLAVAALERNWDVTREGLFERLLSDPPDQGGLLPLRKMVDEIDAYQRRLRADGGAYFGCPFGTVGQEMARQDEQLRATVQRIFDGHVAYLSKMIDRAVSAGEIPPGDTRDRAHRIFALFQGGLLLAKVADDPDHFTSAMAAVPAVVAA